VTTPLDLNRIAELEGLIGPDLGAILASVIQSMSGAIAEADVALAAGDLDAAAYAAHHCRNDALMVGAAGLGAALEALEGSCRARGLDDARTAMARVREVWPATVAELERVTRHDGAR
jgi:HPt (histidine-containing phosphotransfer) domain-containing protein